jgi:hypothetical protein
MQGIIQVEMKSIVNVRRPAETLKVWKKVKIIQSRYQWRESNDELAQHASSNFAEDPPNHVGAFPEAGKKHSCTDGECSTLPILILNKKFQLARAGPRTETRCGTR